MTGSTWTGPEFQVGAERLKAGTKSVHRIPVLTDLDGAPIELAVHAVVGERPGPVLAMHTATHGSEWLAVEITRRTLEALDPREMSGVLLALSVANPIAFATGTRNTLDESDSPDLNRSFGGEQAWLADQLARAISTELYAHADAVVDFHSGLWGAAMGSVTCGRDFTDPSLSERAFRMARAFGLPHIRRSDFVTRFPGPKSGIGHAGQARGVPGIVSELGGAGFGPELEAQWLTSNVTGVRGVMQELGILAGRPKIPDRVLVFDSVRRANPTVGGFLEPLVPPEDMMVREIQPGELLGRVWSPYTFEVVEEIRSPVRGLLNMVCRQYPVRPGDWAYLLVDLDSPGNMWLEGDAVP